MTTIEKTNLAAELSEAFHGGERRQRELRLTAEAARYLRAAYPDLSVTALSSPAGGKGWYLVTFPAPR